MDQEVQELLDKEAQAREELEKRVTALEGSPQLSSDFSAELRDHIQKGDERFQRLEETVAKLGEGPEATAEDKARDALAMTRKVLAGVGDDTARQIINDSNKGHLLQGAAAPTGDPLDNTEFRKGKVEGEGWHYLEKLDASYRLREE